MNLEPGTVVKDPAGKLGVVLASGAIMFKGLGLTHTQPDGLVIVTPPSPVQKSKSTLPDLKAFKFDSTYTFPDEVKILSMVEEFRQPRTTATKMKSPLGYYLRPSAFQLHDSAEAAEVDAHKVVYECVRQIGGEHVVVPAIDEFDETNVNVFHDKKIVLWLRTSQPNSGQVKNWVELREQVISKLYSDYEILTTTHGNSPLTRKELLTHEPIAVWEKLTGNWTAYKRIEELLRLGAV